MYVAASGSWRSAGAAVAVVLVVVFVLLFCGLAMVSFLLDAADRRAALATEVHAVVVAEETLVNVEERQVDASSTNDARSFIGPPPSQVARADWWRTSAYSPFYWSYEPYNSSTALQQLPRFERDYPCEETCHKAKCSSCLNAQLRNSCRAQCSFDEVIDDGHKGTCAHNKSCPRQVTCLEQYPSFHLIPERALFSLVDAAVLLKKPRVRITLLGDSTMQEFFRLARCHLGRTIPNVVISPGANVGLGVSTRVVRHRASEFSINAIQATLFVVLRPDRNITLELVYMAMKRPLIDDLDMLRNLCVESDIFVFHWALWYTPTPIYENHMRIALPVLGECAIMNATVVIDAGHPAQHFKSPMGNYPPVDGVPHMWDCVKINDSVDPDVYMSMLRQHVFPDLKGIAVVPTAWEKNGLDAKCPSASLRALARIHWVPYMDVTRELWSFHKERKGDCTHLESLGVFGTPVWDAIYLATLLETNLKDSLCSVDFPLPNYHAVSVASPHWMREVVRNNFQVLTLPAYNSRNKHSQDKLDPAFDFARPFFVALQRRGDVDYSAEIEALKLRFENESRRAG